MRKALVSSLLLTVLPASAATLQVGPGKAYATPCKAVAAAHAGDLIEVDAGSYDGDHCAWTTDQLTLRGVNGRARIDAGRLQANLEQDKGIFLIFAPTATIENFELSGAVADPSSKNGAGIRHQGQNLTVRGSYLHDNEDGILGSPAVNGTAADGFGTVLIENSELFHNGHGDGQSHNLYLGRYAKFTLRASYSHQSLIGHLVKSRALENHLEYNLLADEAAGTGSYEVDLPEGGLSYLIGNAIEQSQSGASQGNSIVISYGEEGASSGTQALYLSANTVVNDATTGTFLRVAGNPSGALVDNLFRGPGTLLSGGALLSQSSNWTDRQGDPLLVDQLHFDYHLRASSPCIGQGTPPGSGSGQPLLPTLEYASVATTVPRPTATTLDIGAYQFAPATDGGPADAGSSDAGSTDAGSTDAGPGITAPVTGCSATGTSAPLVAAALALALLLRQRRHTQRT